MSDFILTFSDLYIIVLRSCYPSMTIMDQTSETVSQPQSELCFRRVAVGVVSLHSNRTVTKTEHEIFSFCSSSSLVLQHLFRPLTPPSEPVYCHGDTPSLRTLDSWCILLLEGIFFIFYFYFLTVWLFVCMCVCVYMRAYMCARVCTHAQAPIETRRSHENPWSYSYRWLWATEYVC